MKNEKYKLGLSSIEYQVLIGKDGDKWIALVGKNLQDGIAGFGDSIEEALKDLVNELEKNK